jgi:hypothetical protein
MALENAIPEPTLIRSLQTSIAPAFAMHAGVMLGVFTALGDTTLTGAEVGRALNVDPRRLERLLYALVSVGLLEIRGTFFYNGPEAAAYLARENPAMSARSTSFSMNSGVPTC